MITGVKKYETQTDETLGPPYCSGNDLWQRGCISFRVN
ncbi:hypothetical protein BTN49_0248 [Candidatus Enterovibrio escicola]|uniref:Uncharacterized protein n=1 Tax=Candidatus Enterovibrio escicola TaxID=1927127 RepID=A0A2A5T7A5_9GAMM|nr:hypothetical protein BTN49_0248 [Candidatus Enterovibrio escacola]